MDVDDTQCINKPASQEAAAAALRGTQTLIWLLCLFYKVNLFKSPL